MCGETVIVRTMVGIPPSHISTFDDDHGRWQPLFIPLALFIIAFGPSSGHHPPVLAWRSSGCQGVKFLANQTANSLAVALRILFPPMISLASSRLSQVVTGRGMRTLPIMTCQELRVALPSAYCTVLCCTVLYRTSTSARRSVTVPRALGKTGHRLVYPHQSIPYSRLVSRMRRQDTVSAV